MGQSGFTEDKFGEIDVVKSENVVLFPLHPLISDEKAYAQQLKLSIQGHFGGKKCVFYSPYKLERSQNEMMQDIRGDMQGA